MVTEKELIVISNEKVNLNSDGFFCDNLDIKSIPEGLKKDFVFTTGNETSRCGCGESFSI